MTSDLLSLLGTRHTAFLWHYMPRGDECALTTSPLLATRLQEHAVYLQSHGDRDSTVLQTLLLKHPVASEPQKKWMDAMFHVPSVPPQCAHTISSAFPSMGAMMAHFNNPTK